MPGSRRTLVPQEPVTPTSPSSASGVACESHAVGLQVIPHLFRHVGVFPNESRPPKAAPLAGKQWPIDSPALCTGGDLDLGPLGALAT